MFVKSCILDLLPRTNHGHFELYSTPGKMTRRADAYVVPTESFDSESNPPSGRSASGLSPGRFVPFGRSTEDNSKSCSRNLVSWITIQEKIVTVILSYTRRPGKFVWGETVRQEKVRGQQIHEFSCFSLNNVYV